MPVVGMIGPHAVGKTTAARRWLKRFPLLTVAFCDDQWEETSAGRVRVREWKGTKEEKIAQALRVKADASRVTLIESARGFSTWLSVFAPTDPVIVITCSEPLGRRWLEERRGGRPLGPYWTERRLEYECRGRLMNYVTKKLDPKQVRHFEFADRDAGWEEVDRYFTSLYRPLHNAIVRARGAGV